MEKYLDATQEAGIQFYQQFVGKGKIVMLNLLRYRERADYSEFKELESQQDLSGKEAYKLYMDHTLPELEKAGSKILFFGDSSQFLIGPTDEKWDAVLLVEHESAEKFIAFSQNAEYLKTVGHRAAALEDSRLLPIKSNS